MTLPADPLTPQPVRRWSRWNSQSSADRSAVASMRRVRTRRSNPWQTDRLVLEALDAPGSVRRPALDAVISLGLGLAQAVKGPENPSGERQWWPVSGSGSSAR